MKYILIIEDISGTVTEREIKLSDFIILLQSKSFLKETKNMYLEKIKGVKRV